MQDCSRHLLLSQSRVPLYEKYITVIYALGSAHDDSAVALQRRIVRQTLPNLMLFAAPNLICRTELIQTPLFCRT